jgi:nitroimidazol reductase NimA-like FMN-containing flavoprotein (pyridoxamine 5'-phosphate oxidase superfamily)
MDNTQKVKEIIEKNLYITMATYDYKARKPWVTPLYSAYDENYNFFWASGRQTQHSQNISANNEVAIVIFDSTIPEGAGEGVYIEAVAFELNKDEEIEHALEYINKKVNTPERHLFDFTDNSPLRIYKAVPKKIWMNSSELKDRMEVDVRTDVYLK